MPSKSNPFVDKIKNLPLFKRSKKKKVKKATGDKTNKRKSKKRKFKSPLLNLLHGIFIVLSNIVLLLVLAGCIAGVYVCNEVLDIVNATPIIDPSTIESSLTENSKIIDQNGNLLETLFGDDGRREMIEFEDINENMINAIIALEDKTYFDHKGFNYMRLLGSIRDAYLTQSDPKGTSTITQQLAKNLYLSGEHSMERKIQEAYYAIILERTLSKDQIMWGYLNKISFGLKLHGVESAANFYFSKDAKDLNLVESVILAGIPKSPAAYAPISRLFKDQVREDHIVYDDNDPIYTLVFNPSSQARFEKVLKDMYNNDMITEAEYMLRNEQVIDYIRPSIDQGDEITSFFGDMVRDEAAQLLADHEGVTVQEAMALLYSRGYIIESTIDLDIQKTVEGIYNATLFTDNYDDVTYDAVKLFQEQEGLYVDGVVGSKTLAALIAATSLTEEDFEKSYYAYGTFHDDVINIKSGLSELNLISDASQFPRPTVLLDANGNIVDDETGKTRLYKRDSLINEEGQMIVANSSYYYNENDDLVILANKGFRFYQKEVGVQVEMEDMFIHNEGDEILQYIDGRKYYRLSGMYTFKGREVMIPREYTSKVDGNLVIDKQMFVDYPNYFQEADNGDLLVDPIASNNGINFYITERGVIQPQSAFVLMDHNTGEIKAIIGGRDAEGKNIFNRALSPHQPGSSIKPIGAYTAAIASGEYTAATVMDDVPLFLNKDTPDVRWPHNWYDHHQYKYHGRQTLRQALQDSVNVIAVDLAQRVGTDAIISHLKNLGITTIDEEGGVNDLNAAALALGGMSQGISPLELTAAYATYANQGVYTKPIVVSRITDLDGNVIVENKPEQRVVMTEQLAYIMQDLMVSAVTTGVSNAANMKTMTMAGKTGTTSDNKDVTFVGYTPYYTGAVWFGNDVKLKMDENSLSPARFWKKIMLELHKDLEDKPFVEPSGLVKVSVDAVSGKRPSELSYLDPEGSQVYQEIFLPNTAPTDVDDAHVKVTICLDHEEPKLANEYCENTEEAVFRTRLTPYDYENITDKWGNPLLTSDHMYIVPTEVCDIHEYEYIEIDDEEVATYDRVIETVGVGQIEFIRDYNLLLHNGEFIFIPMGSTMGIDGTITFEDGTVILPEEYNVLFVTKPQTQKEEILRRTLEEQDQDPQENESQDPPSDQE